MLVVPTTEISFVQFQLQCTENTRELSIQNCLSQITIALTKHVFVASFPLCVLLYAILAWPNVIPDIPVLEFQPKRTIINTILLFLPHVTGINAPNCTEEVTKTYLAD